MQWPLCHKRISQRRLAVVGVLLTVGRDSLQWDCGNLTGGQQSQYMAKMMEQASARVPVKSRSEKPKHCMMRTKGIFVEMSSYVTV